MLLHYMQLGLVGKKHLTGQLQGILIFLLWLLSLLPWDLADLFSSSSPTSSGCQIQLGSVSWDL